MFFHFASSSKALQGPFASRTPRLPHPSKAHGYVPPGPGTYATVTTALDVRDSSPSASFALPGAGNPAKYFAETEPGPGSYLGTAVVVPSGILALAFSGLVFPTSMCCKTRHFSPPVGTATAIGALTSARVGCY